MLHITSVLTIKDIQSPAVHKMKLQNRKYTHIYIYFFLWGGWVSIVNAYGLGTQEFNSQSDNCFLPTAVSSLALGPSLLNKWVPGTLPPWGKAFRA
jgi:hypothetical protein